MNDAVPTDLETSADLELYQEVIVEHKRAPRHFGTLPAPTHEAHGHNPQCGDDVAVQLRLEGEVIRDVAFSGHGCAICIASASMMTEAVLGREVAAARGLQRRFRSVLTGELAPQAAALGKLASLAGVRRYPSRIKCALLGWHALVRALDSAAPPAERDS